MNYKIGGCDVSFPHQAYGVQLSFMAKVITALEKGENALLEAPTGSGKTLSLLCSSLAWQHRQKRRLEEGYIAQTTEYNQVMAQKQKEMEERQLAEAQAAPPKDLPQDPDSAKDTAGSGDHEQPDSKKQKRMSPPPPPSEHLSEQERAAAKLAALIAEWPQEISEEDLMALEGGFIPGAEEVVPRPVRGKAPKIYYATRTHSQIAQVVRELKRCNPNMKMAILASKSHYCVNSFAKQQTSSVEDACEDLLKDSNCVYFKGVGSMITSEHSYKVHDIEDLGQIGRDNKACPYFVSRKWAEEADIIFGPYNYFIDPVIRRSMKIDLEGCVVIFDEAHNIEDVSRDSASMDLDRHTMRTTHGALIGALAANGNPIIYRPLIEACESVIKWLAAREAEAVVTTSKARRSKFDPYNRSWEGSLMMEELARMQFGPGAVEPLWEAYQAAREKDEEIQSRRGERPAAPAPGQPAGSSTPKEQRVGSLALGTMSRLIQILRMIHEVSDNGGRDYRLVMQRMHAMSAQAAGFKKGGGGQRRRGKNNNGDNQGAEEDDPDEYIMVMSLWCMNPGVAFRQIASMTHSIVLTSGTLAPLDSFASELGTTFNVRLEAPHVVNMANQVWAGVVSRAPSGMQLIAKYDQTSTERFQDALGKTVLSMCRKIPDGVLLFLPSYSLLDVLTKRWQANGTWRLLAQVKTIVSEPRKGGAEALQLVMDAYYGAIQQGKGGLFLAVCRGKVSEGLDFADKNARGVIVVGIPFSNITDIKVKLKKAYNDQCSRTLGLLPSNIWYEQQAFRALNQAVGRCIRHRLDWGAILLVDERFRERKYQMSLSRWVRGAITMPMSFEECEHSLGIFFARLTANPPGGAPAVPALPAAEKPPAADKAAAPDVAAEVKKEGIAAYFGPAAPAAPSTKQEAPADTNNNYAHPRAQHAQQGEQTPLPLAQRQTQDAIQAMLQTEDALLSSWVESDYRRYYAVVEEQVGRPDNAQIVAEHKGDLTSLTRMGILDGFELLREHLDQSPETSVYMVVPANAVQALILGATAQYPPLADGNKLAYNGSPSQDAIAFAGRYLLGAGALPVLPVLHALKACYEGKIDVIMRVTQRSTQPCEDQAMQGQQEGAQEHQQQQVGQKGGGGKAVGPGGFIPLQQQQQQEFPQQHQPQQQHQAVHPPVAQPPQNQQYPQQKQHQAAIPPPQQQQQQQGGFMFQQPAAGPGAGGQPVEVKPPRGPFLPSTRDRFGNPIAPPQHQVGLHNPQHQQQQYNNNNNTNAPPPYNNNSNINGNGNRNGNGGVYGAVNWSSPGLPNPPAGGYGKAGAGGGYVVANANAPQGVWIQPGAIPNQQQQQQYQQHPAPVVVSSAMHASVNNDQGVQARGQRTLAEARAAAVDNGWQGGTNTSGDASFRTDDDDRMW